MSLVMGLGHSCIQPLLTISAVPSVKIRYNEEVQVVRTGKVRLRIEILEIVGKLNGFGMRRGFLEVNA